MTRQVLYKASSRAYIDNSPRISSAAYFLSIDVQYTIGAHHSKREFGIDISLLRELIEVYFGVSNLTHDLLLEAQKLFRCQSVSFANHRNNVHLKLRRLIQ